MDQFWVCQHCKSLNRAGTGRCYRCKEKMGSLPAQPGSAAKPAQRPLNPPPPRQEFNVGEVPPPYLSRPLSPPLGSTSFTAAAAAAEAEARRGPAGPITVMKRRVSRWLSGHPIVNVSGLGYATAVVMLLSLLAAIVLAVLLLPVAIDLLQSSNAPHAWARLAAGQQRTVEIAAGLAAVVGLLALALFSIFVGLSTHNAAALGADMPVLTPYAAGVAWPRATWRHLEIALGAGIPTAIVWLGWPIPGLIVAVIFVEVALRRLQDPWAWFRGPNRHVPDLYVKLGTEGSMDSLLASTWALCYRIANSLAILLWLVPPVALAVETAARAASWTTIPGWQSGGIGPLQAALAALAVAMLVSAAIAQALLLPLIVGLVNRQSARRVLVRMGRARSWVGGRPAGTDYASIAPGGARPVEWDQDDRIVERAARPAPADDDGMELLASISQRAGILPGAERPAPPWAQGAGAGPVPGFPPVAPPLAPDAAPAGANESPDLLPGRGLAFGDQASLNSPSTTSSFPWSEPPASE